MPKRTDISTILIIGAGPIVIGQACEFDYSGTQACKALKAEGYRVVLVNSNPATIMTDPDLADATYIEPITPEIVTQIIEKERYAIPGGFALLPTMGGQTALNTALSLRKMGTLEKFDVTMIGATADAIDKAEDRKLFREAMHKIGLETPRSHQVKTLIQALEALEDIGLPAIIRPSFTLGGTGGGIAYNKAEFIEIVERGIDASPTSEVLIEESVLGWKEFEMEVVRDKKDNCIIICSIENLDPMGVHTGDSITIAPALTLTDKEYQIMRDASIAVLREIGVETGGSNVQFAVNPADGRLVIIEMNPRVSRSSALASKATGFPIAKVAAKLAVGYTLGRDRQRHHRRRHAGVVRADHRLHRHQDPALCLREISRRRADPDHVDEIGRRGDGDRAHVPGKFAEGAALAGNRPHRARRDHHPRPRPGRRQERDPRRARHADARPPPGGGAGHAARHERRRDPHRLPDRSVVFGADPRHRRNRSRNPRQSGCPPTAGALRRLKAMGFSDARLAKLTGETTADGDAKAPRASACGRCSSASTPAPPNSLRPRPTCIRPTTCRSPAAPSMRRRRPTRRKSSSSAAARTASARVSSSIIAAATPPSRSKTSATKPSWSIAIRRRCRPITTPRTGSISSRSPTRTCSKSSTPSAATARCTASSCNSAARRRSSSPSHWNKPTCRSSAPRPTPSISPRTATASSSCSIA